MKKTTLLLITILFTLLAKSQETLLESYLPTIKLSDVREKEVDENIERLYFNSILAYGGKVLHFNTPISFYFNLKEGILEYCPYNGDGEIYTFLSEFESGIDKYGDGYKIVKSISKNIGKIVYIQIYNKEKHGINFYYEGGNALIHFSNPIKE